MTDSLPLRTVHVDTERVWGGGQRQVAWLVRGLAARGHPPLLLTRRGSRFPDVLSSPDTPVLSLDPKFEWDPVAAVRIRRAAARFGADLVVAHTAHAAALVAVAGLGSPRRFVVTRRVALPIGRSPLSRWKYRRAALVVAVSDRVRAVLLESGVESARVAVIHSGVDLSRSIVPATPDVLHSLGVDAARPLAVMVSALTPPHKDPLTFVRAFAALRTRHPEVQGLLVGGGPLAPRVRTEIARLRLDGVVRMAGHRDDAERLLAAASVAVLTSRDEGLGTTILDAMQCGVPVVATAAGGVRETVRDGMDGLLAPVGDAAAVGTAVARVLEDPRLRETLTASAALRVRAFAADTMVDRTVDAYRRALYSARC